MVILDGTAQTVEGLDPCLVQLAEEVIRKAELVASGILGVGVEQGEDIGHVHEDAAAQKPARIVESGVGNGRLGEVGEGVAERPEHGGVVDGVHGLDGGDGGGEVYVHGKAPFQ